MLRWLALAALLVGCKKHEDSAPAPAPAVEKAPAPKKPDGPSITPIVTSSVTFFAPKEAPWWGEMSFACYAAAIRLQAGSQPSAAFTQISPAVAPAMRAGDIDLDHDVAAIGLWGCGEGACMYAAVELRHPEKLPALLEALTPGAKAKQVGKDHYTIDAPGETGPRTIHLQAVPVVKPTSLPADPWSRDAARATHLLFVTGLFGKSTEVDPIAQIDERAAAARIKDVEGVVPDAHGMCVRGYVGPHDFQPGYKLSRARFAFAAPDGKSDALTGLLGSTRTLDLEVELTLDPAPTPTIVDQWIAQARAWVRGIVDPMRAQFASQGELVNVMIDMGGVLGTRAFHHEIKDHSLVLSFRSDRIPQSDLATFESRLQSLVGTP